MLSTSRFGRFVTSVAATILIGSMNSAQGVPLPIYWQNFENGDGTADLSPGGGDLGIVNSATGTVAFSNSGGIFGGALNATGQNQQDDDPSGIATTTAGSAISNLPNQTGNGAGSMNQFTITYWVKHTGAAPNSGSVTPRILTLADSGSFDAGANAVQMHLRNTGGTGTNFRTMAMPFERGSANNATNATDADFIGTEFVANTWYFVALTYDGTSALANDSTVQGAATGSGPTDLNGQYYKGTEDLLSPLTRLGVAFTSDTSSPVPGDVSNGPVEFGSAARLYLMNRIADASNTAGTMNRGLQGWIDDVRIYDSVLSAADVDLVRQQGLLGIVPEPSSFILCVMALGGLRVLRSKRGSRTVAR